MKAYLKSKITNPFFLCAAACFCCLLWGSAFPVIKIGYSLLGIRADDYASQILFAGIRFSIAGVLTILFGSLVSKSAVRVKKQSAYKVIALALFQTVLQYLFFYVGLANTTGTKGSILDSTSVFFSVLIATFILKQERLTVTKVLGCLLGFAGVVAVHFSSGMAEASFNLKGDGFIILSALSYAVSSVMIKQFSKDDNPVALSGYQFILGGVIMAAVGLSLGGKLLFSGIKAVLIILYLALVSAAAYTLWGMLLKYNPVSRVTVFGFMTPVFGCILSALLLGESLADSGIKTITALLLICFGIFLVNKEKKYEGKNDTR